MKYTSRMHIGTSVLLGALFLALFAQLFVAITVHASFPGTNGRIVFSTERDGNREIYTMNPDGTSLVRLTNNADFDSEPSWSPDGSKILFRSDRDGNREIYTMNPDGTNQTRLTNEAQRDMQARFSPDGSKILFVSDRGQALAQYRLWIMNNDGTGQVQLTSAFGAQPSWSPDGSKIVYNCANEICTINADGSNVQMITTGGQSVAPDWSPNGLRIVYSRNDGTDNEIHTMDVDGSDSVQLTTNSGNDHHPVWSPDGTRILYDSNISGNYDIMIMNSDGTGQIALASNPAFEEYPYFLTIPIIEGEDEPVILAPNTGVGPAERSLIHDVTFALFDALLVACAYAVYRLARR